MADRTSAELEREAEQIRASIADTADRLRSKMSAGQIFDEVSGFFRASEASTAAQNLQRQVADNPIALALVGAGITWMIAGGGPRLGTSRHDSDAYSQDYDTDADRAAFTSSTDETGGPSMSERLGDAASRTGSYASSLGRSAADRASQFGRSAASSASDYGYGAAERAGHVISENPVALALIGAGIGWLLMGSRSSSRDRYYDDDYDYSASRRGYGPYNGGPGLASMGEADEFGYEGAGDAGVGSYADEDERYSGGSGTGPSTRERLGNVASSTGSMGRSVLRRTSELGQSAAETASHLGQSAAETASQLGQSAAERARYYSDRAARAGYRVAGQTREYADYGRRRFVDVLDREPLVLGAIGLAVGAALGALVPRSRYEEEYLGPVRDRLGEEAGQALSRAAEDARHVASEAYNAARQAAQEEGLLPEGKPLAERLGNVARAVADTALHEGTERAESEKNDAADRLDAAKQEAQDKARSATGAGSGVTSTGSASSAGGTSSATAAPAIGAGTGSGSGFGTTPTTGPGSAGVTKSSDPTKMP